MYQRPRSRTRPVSLTHAHILIKLPQILREPQRVSILARKKLVGNSGRITLPISRTPNLKHNERVKPHWDRAHWNHNVEEVWFNPEVESRGWNERKRGVHLKGWRGGGLGENGNVAEKTAKSAESTSFRNDYDVFCNKCGSQPPPINGGHRFNCFREKSKCHRVFAEIPKPPSIRH